MENIQIKGVQKADTSDSRTQLQRSHEDEHDEQ